MSVNKERYFKLIVMGDKLYRLFLEAIRKELRELKIRDITSVQCLIVYHVGLAGEKLTVGDFTERGYYLGENISYNLSKMVKNGYFIQFQNNDDKRCYYVKLSKKGVKLYETLDELFKRQAHDLEQCGLHNNHLVKVNGIMNVIENLLKGIKNG